MQFFFSAKDETPVASEFMVFEDVPLVPGQDHKDLPAPARTFTYFYYDLKAADNIRNVVVSMTRTDNESDPDLYVKVGEQPNRNSYDGADTSTNLIHNVDITIQPADKRLWIGIYTFSEQPAVVTLRFDVYNCGNKNCGGDKQGTCLVETGACECKKGFTAENCRSAIIDPAEFDTNYSASLGSYDTVYFKFNANIKQYGYMKTLVTRENAMGLMTVMAAKDRLPTPDDNDGMAYAYGSISEAILNLDKNAMSAGSWVLAVSISSRISEPITVVLSSHLSFCDNDCSGHGTCNEETSVCTCDENYTGNPNCSVYSTPLAKDKPLTVTLEPSTYLHYTIPLAARYASGPIEMSVKFETTTKEEDVINYPVLYLSRSIFPTTSKYDVVSPVPGTRTQSIFVPAHDLTAGDYFLMVDNSATHAVEGILTVKLTPHCANNCNGAGTCNEFGECVCNNGRLGGDCGTDAEMCGEFFDLPHGGLSVGATVLAVFIAIAIGAGSGVFLFKKFGNSWFAPPQRSNPDLQYNQLN